MLARAQDGCFESESLHELPPSLVEQAFERVGSRYCVRPKHREGTEFLEQDLRLEMPLHHFDLILCRYVVFTYFAVPLQRKILAGMLERLRPSGYFVIGTHEHLPGDVPELVPLVGAPQVFRKETASRESKQSHIDNGSLEAGDVSGDEVWVTAEAREGASQGRAPFGRRPIEAIMGGQLACRLPNRLHRIELRRVWRQSMKRYAPMIGSQPRLSSRVQIVTGAVVDNQIR